MRTTAKTRDFPIIVIIIIIILRSREGFTFSDNKNGVNVCGGEKKEKQSFRYSCFLGIRQKKAEVKLKSRSRNRPRPGIQRSIISSLQSPLVESR